MESPHHLNPCRLRSPPMTVHPAFPVDGAPAPAASAPLTVRVVDPLSLSDELAAARSEEHTSELQSLMRISYAVFCLKKKKTDKQIHPLLLVGHINYDMPHSST